MKWIKRILIAGVFLAIAGFLVWKFIINKEIDNVKNQQPDFTTTMSDLFKEFSAGDSIAKLKYNGKLLEISGMVKKIEVGDSATVLNLGDTASESVVICQIDKRNNELAKKLKEKETITVKGHFSGVNNLGEFEGINLGINIEMKDCAIINKK